MKRRAGFTVVELMIVIVIMAILLTLSVVSLDGTQKRARDEERKTDIANIARALESEYVSPGEYNTKGEYPSVYLMVYDADYIQKNLADIDINSLRAPGQETGISLTRATNGIATTAGVQPQPGINDYVYQPMADADTLCYNNGYDCRSFNLYYRSEADNIIHKVTSKHQ